MATTDKLKTFAVVAAAAACDGGECRRVVSRRIKLSEPSKTGILRESEREGAQSAERSLSQSGRRSKITETY